MMKTRIGILGYGNLGKGVELAARQNDDIELVAIFSRRDPSTITPLTAGVPVFSVDDIEAHTNDVDVLVLGGGSARTDAEIRQALQRGRFVRHAREHPAALRSS